MIRLCTDAEIGEIEAVINEAAQSYRGVIPADCWHEPYMSRSDLIAECAAGVNFWCWHETGGLVGVMGLQKVLDVFLIRHAYVRQSRRGQGIGGALLRRLTSEAAGPLLVGTWSAASWATRFYEGHGFRAVSAQETDRLLKMYWSVPALQRQSSVVLVRLPELLAGAAGTPL